MIVNVHERTFPGADPVAIAELLDGLGQPGDRLWPDNGRWPRMTHEAPLTELPRGRHGLVRYRVTEHVPGRLVTWRFDDRVGLDGFHRMEHLDTAAGPMLRHTIRARPRGSMRLAWPLAVRPLHDQCLEDLLDGAAAELGVAHDPTPPSRWVRFLLWIAPPEREERLAAGRERANVRS